MSRWPLWRLLIVIEVWLLAVAAAHRLRPFHDEFLIPLLVAGVPAAALVVLWGLVRAFGGQPAAASRAGALELLIAAVACLAAFGWGVRWAQEAHQDLGRLDALLGTETLILDVSLTWIAALACFAALTLDWLLSAARGQWRGAMTGLRWLHVTVTVLHVAALFGSAWLLTRWPESAAGDTTVLFQRGRTALHVYEYARATVLPVQALFAAMAVAIAALDSRVD